MKGSTLQKFVLIPLCHWILPILITILLLIMPIHTTRALFLGSIVLEWGTRVCLALFFCMSYWNLPTLYSPKNKWQIGKWAVWFESKTPQLLMGLFVINALVYGIGVALITLLSIAEFAPSLASFQIVISTINGVICSSILIPQYKDYRRGGYVQNH